MIETIFAVIAYLLCQVLLFYVLYFFFLWIVSIQVARLGSINDDVDLDSLLSNHADQSLINLVEKFKVQNNFALRGIKVHYRKTSELYRRIAHGAVAGCNYQGKEVYLNIGWVLESSNWILGLRKLFVESVMVHEDSHLRQFEEFVRKQHLENERPQDNE